MRSMILLALVAAALNACASNNGSEPSEPAIDAAPEASCDVSRLAVPAESQCSAPYADPACDPVACEAAVNCGDAPPAGLACRLFDIQANGRRYCCAPEAG